MTPSLLTQTLPVQQVRNVQTNAGEHFLITALDWSGLSDLSGLVEVLQTYNLVIQERHQLQLVVSLV